MYRRGRIWWISVGGIRQTSGTADRERAKALEHKLNTEAWDREHGFITPTWEQACLSWMDNNPKAAVKYHNALHNAWWKEHLKGKRLTKIEPKDIHQIICQYFKVGLEDKLPANSTANGYVAFVGKIFRHAGKRITLTYYPKSTGRDRWLTLDEWKHYSSKMYEDLRDISTFGLATGLREANDMFFRWKWLHDDDTWVLLPPEITKTDKPYGIPLNKTAQAIIKRRRLATLRHPEYVFLNRGKVWYRVALCIAIKDAVEAAGIPRITYHGFRHTFASWLAQKGVSEAIRARLGCWATKSQTDHYSHFDVDTLRPFSELIDVMLAAKKSQSKANA